jgi:hypothetical protein
MTIGKLSVLIIVHGELVIPLVLAPYSCIFFAVSMEHALNFHSKSPNCLYF